MRPFHLAFPVANLETAKSFYADVLGATIGRTSENWIDFNFFGHQITAHRVTRKDAVHHNPVDAKSIPIPHFGVILTPKQFEEIEIRIRSAGILFLVEPYTRFEGDVGEQKTMFVDDGNGNAIEFKAFWNDEMIFASH